MDIKPNHMLQYKMQEIVILATNDNSFIALIIL